MRLCIAFAILTALPIRAVADDAVEDFRLIEATGEVAVIPAGSQEARVAKAGLPLSEGDRVVTGATGAAELAAKSGTVIRLDSNSSLGLENLRSGWTTFRLSIGRFLGRFQRSPGSRYNVKTPVAVASVRGTEFALDVAEDGALDAGVVEGEVAIEPAEDAAPDAPAWTEEVLTASQGLQLKPLERPRRLAEIPAPLVPAVAWFPRVRDRVPALRESWKDLDPPARQKLRQQALRDRLNWKVPPRLRGDLPSPRKSLRPAPAPRKVAPPVRRPTRPSPSKTH